MRASDIWTKTTPSFPSSLLSKVKIPLHTAARQNIRQNIRRFFPSSLPEGFFSLKEQDSRASNPAPGYLLLRLNSRWLLMRGGTPIYHPTPTHGMEVLLWMQSTKSTRILIMLAPACKIVVPCEESWAKRTLAAAHPPPPHWLLSCWSRGGHAERSLSLLPSLAPEPWLREFAWERIRSSNM